MFKHGDPFSHHGELAMFLKAEQHREQQITPDPAYRKPDGAPYRSNITVKLQEMTKLYLVPSLGEAEDKQAEQAQERLITSLSAESRARFFPRHSHPDINRLLSIGDHFMSQYQPYIHNQLLESIDPERPSLW